MSVFFVITITIVVLVSLMLEAVMRWNEPWAKPALAVYGTAGMWYPANLFYAGLEHFRDLFPDTIIATALFQVCGFLIFLRLFIPLACRLLAKKNALPTGSVQIQPFHEQIAPLFWSVFILWLVLFLAGAIRLEGDVLPVIWPPLAKDKVLLFSHSGIGGSTGFIIASAQYSYQLVCALFGITFVLGKGWIRMMALVLMCLTWPYFLFDRMRNVQLAVVMPMLIAYILLGRSRPFVKGFVTFGWLVIIYVWFLLVGLYRSDYDMSRFLSVPRTSSKTLLETRHFGLDMLEELCYVNLFIKNGTYQINYGERYMGEFLNFIPRAIWKNKPLLGYDYAVARGFTNLNAGYREVGVTATIATGMIGQGVINFGRFFGVIAASVLMAFWVGLLARHWAERWIIGKAFLFLLGMGLTFNLGRDITLLVLWPFVFASFGVWILGSMTTTPYYSTASQAPRRRHYGRPN